MIPYTLIRGRNPLLIGSASYGLPSRDIDILVSVPEPEIAAFEAELLALGFVRNEPEPDTLDPLVCSSFSCGYVDIQIATPENYEKKRRTHDMIRARRLYRGCTKRERYGLYRVLGG
jgi:hypothetical protein